MEHLAWYELLLLFFAASFLGWVLETATADIKQKKFVNRGLVTGPFCVMYGITTVLLTVGLGELRGIWLFLFSAIYATVVEWIGGHLIERLFHQRWWDYSGRKWNLDGYICLSASAFWGVLGFVMVTWGNDLLFRLMALLPLLLVKILLLVLAGVLVVDILASYILLRGYGKKIASGKRQITGSAKSRYDCKTGSERSLHDESERHTRKQWRQKSKRKRKRKQPPRYLPPDAVFIKLFCYFSAAPFWEI